MRILYEEIDGGNYIESVITRKELSLLQEKKPIDGIFEIGDQAYSMGIRVITQEEENATKTGKKQKNH